MKAKWQHVLVQLVGHGVIKIQTPQYGVPLPFTCDLEILETIPAVRRAVLDFLFEHLTPHRHEFDIVSAVPGGCKVLAALLAHELNLPYILPLCVDTHGAPSIFLYGAKKSSEGIHRILLVQEFVKNSASVENMHRILFSQGCITTRVVALIDADRVNSVNRFLQYDATTSAVYDSMFRMDDVLDELETCSDRYGLQYELVHAARVHFAKMAGTLPP